MAELIIVGLLIWILVQLKCISKLLVSMERITRASYIVQCEGQLNKEDIARLMKGPIS